MFQQTHSGSAFKLVREPVLCLVMNPLQPFISAGLQHAQHSFPTQFVMSGILGTLRQLCENKWHQYIAILQSTSPIIGIEPFLPQAHQRHQYAGQPAVKGTR